MFRVEGVGDAEGDFATSGVVSGHEDATAETIAAGEAVDPSDAVGVVECVVGKEGEGFVEISGFAVLDADVGSFDRAELEGEIADDSGEAHPAGGCPEQVLVFTFWLTNARFATGENESDLGDPLGEGAVAVVVFAMDIGGEAPAKGAEPGTGGDGNEPAFWDEDIEECVEAESGFGGEASGVGVELEAAIEAFGEDCGATGEEGGIAVAASEASGENLTFWWSEVSPPFGADEARGGAGDTAPAAEIFDAFEGTTVGETFETFIRAFGE